MAAGESSLKPKGPTKELIALNLSQAGIFTSIFAALSSVLGSLLAKTGLFVGATLITAWRTLRFDIPAYWHDENKNAEKTADLAIKVLTTLAEILAVVFAMKAAWSIPMVPLFVAPAMFVAITGTHCLTHFIKMIDHIRLMRKAHKDTDTYQYHKNQVKANAIAAISFGLTTVMIGLLMLLPLVNPASALVPLAAGFIQYGGAAFLFSINILYMGYRSIKGYRQSTKVVPESDLDKSLYEVPEPRVAEQNEASPQAEVPFEEKADAAIQTRPKYTPPAKQPETKYADLGRFTDIALEFSDLEGALKNSVHHPASDAPQKIMLDFLEQENTILKTALKRADSDVSLKWDDSNKYATGDLNIGKQDDHSASVLLADQRPQRDKLYVQLLLKEMIEKGSVCVPYTNGNDPIKINSVEGLKKHIKDKGIEANVYTSVSKRMQKIMALADIYMSSPNLRKENRNGAEMEMSEAPAQRRAAAAAA